MRGCARMLFRKMTEADKPLVDSYLARTDYPGSDYSMLYLSGWDFFNFENSMQIAESGGALYIRFRAKRRTGIGDASMPGQGVVTIRMPAQNVTSVHPAYDE